MALIPYKDDFLVFGCASSTWYLSGNPCDGGIINELDLTTGVFGSQSWSFDGSDNLYFWGTNGIYRTTIPGRPICISEIRLPNLIKDENANRSDYRIALAYDRSRKGILITLTRKTVVTITNSNYWLDLRVVDEASNPAIFPESYPAEASAFSAFFYEATHPTYRKLILGGSDGYLRFFDNTAKNDDAGVSGDVKIDSYVTFGPIAMAEDLRSTGKITGLNCITAGGALNGSQSDSDDITYKIFVAKSSEEVLEKLYAGTSPAIGGTIKAPGRQRGGSKPQKAKGVYMGIKLQNDTLSKTWAFEQLLYNLKSAGRLK